MEATHAITIENLSKTFHIPEDRKTTLKSLVASMFNQGRSREFKALDGINLAIEKGDFVGIVGRNGSGKSTLLKLIAGIYTPDKGGKVKIHGRLVPFLELGVGFNADLSGRENIFLNGTILGMTHDYLEKKFDEIVQFAELEEFIDLPVKNFSSGMMVRLAFSIAVQTDADVYILDEILAVGDALFQKKSLRVIDEFRAQGKTVLYVSHSMESIAQYCNKAILIDKGKLLMESSPSKVIESYDKVNAAQNEKLYRIEDAGIPDHLPKPIKEKKIKLKNLQLLNAKGQPTDTVKTGDTIILEATFDRFAEIPILNFHVGVHSVDERSVVTGFNSLGEKVVLNKDGNVRITFENIVLSTGVYHLSAMVLGKVWEEVYDIVPFIQKFYVQNPDNGVTFGRIVMPHKWESV